MAVNSNQYRLAVRTLTKAKDEMTPESLRKRIVPTGEDGMTSSPTSSSSTISRSSWVQHGRWSAHSEYCQPQCPYKKTGSKSGFYQDPYSHEWPTEESETESEAEINVTLSPNAVGIPPESAQTNRRRDLIVDFPFDRLPFRYCFLLGLIIWGAAFVATAWNYPGHELARYKHSKRILLPLHQPLIELMEFMHEPLPQWEQGMAKSIHGFEDLSTLAATLCDLPMEWADLQDRMDNTQSDQDNLTTSADSVEHEDVLMAQFPGANYEEENINAVTAACKELIALSDLVDPFDAQYRQQNITLPEWPVYLESAMDLKESATAEVIRVGQDIIEGLDNIFDPDRHMRYSSDLVWEVIKVWIHALDKLVAWDANLMEVYPICSYRSDASGDWRCHGPLKMHSPHFSHDNTTMQRYWRPSLFSSPQLARRLERMSTAADHFVQVARRVDTELGHLYETDFQGSYARTDSRLAFQFHDTLRKLEEYACSVRDTTEQLITVLEQLDAMRCVVREVVRYAYKPEGWLEGNDGVWRGYEETADTQVKFSSQRGPLFPGGRVTYRLNDTILQPMFSDLPLCLMVPSSHGHIQLESHKKDDSSLNKLLQEFIERLHQPQRHGRNDNTKRLRSMGMACNDNGTWMAQLWNNTDSRASYPGQSYTPRWQRFVLDCLPDWLTWKLAPAVFVAPLRVPDVHLQMRIINGLLDALEELQYEYDEKEEVETVLDDEVV